MAKIALGTWAWGTGAFGDFPACIFFLTLISLISQKLFPSETLKICVLLVIWVHDCDTVFGSHTNVENLKPVFDAASDRGTRPRAL